MKTQETSHHCTIVGENIRFNLEPNVFGNSSRPNYFRLFLLKNKIKNLIKPPKIHVTWYHHSHGIV